MEGLKSLMMNENNNSATTGLVEGLIGKDEDLYGWSASESPYSNRSVCLERLIDALR